MIDLSYTEIHAFRKIGYGCLPSHSSLDGVHWQTDLIIRLPTNEIKSREMKTAKIKTSIELHAIDDFPLVRMTVTIDALPGNPAKMECFFNLTREDHAKLIDELSRQTTLRIHLFGDNLKYSHSKQVGWYLQSEATDILQIGVAMSVGKMDADFERAKTRFMEENEL